ncbi:hypothetical protein V7I75_30650 [Pseudomonas aeruginosa]|jgi:hypothetical protein|nr:MULTISPECIES: hypothetical protein [Pseudomonas aeruginosa group]EIU2790027.1 hypothetical protein [Pseudomonas aeruginosa]EIU3359861.1 hypothetical protein [Pseudomonas aeruginosa]EIU3488621.1 hypothetical protein [Pseudomonas aeruginosa]EIU3553261.1 hypothetical protein [Pseudomonas aeruginosa]EIU3574186.1 hypothetical protein [Pseudomonas aeruginosa]
MMTTTPITLVFNTDDGLDDAVMAEAYVLTPDGPAQVLVDTQKLWGAAAIQFFYRYPNAKKYGLSQCACHAGAASFAAAHGFVTTNMSLKTEDSHDDSGDHIEITVNAPNDSFVEGGEEALQEWVGLHYQSHFPSLDSTLRQAYLQRYVEIHHQHL